MNLIDHKSLDQLHFTLQHIMLNNTFFPLFFIFALIFAVYGGSTDGVDYCKKRGSGKGRIVGGDEARPGTLQIIWTIEYCISSYKALSQIIPAILITLCRRNVVFSNKTHI